MSDDLVKRLRSLGSAGPGRISFLASEDAVKAADRIEKDAAHIDEMYELVAAMNADHTASKTRIEKLEDELHHCFHRINELQAALREIIVHCEVPAPPNAEALKMFARKALEGKDD